MATDSGRAETRAIWVVRTDLTSPEKISRAIELATANNFNTLVVQVRGRGDAFYNSHFEPRAESLEGQPDSFDPLQMYVDEGHRAGLRILAWLNTHYCWQSETMPKSPEHIINKHPEWLMRTSKNEYTLTGGGETEGAYTCPSNPEVKEFLKDCFLDVVKNYDVDGINFDYVRYPNPEFCFCDTCLSRFKAEMDKEMPVDLVTALSASAERLAYVEAFSDEFDQFRRDQITDLVGLIYRETKKIKPDMPVTADVFPNYEDAYGRRFQDWKLWMKQGILDILLPMAYFEDTEAFAKSIADAVESSNGRPVYAGIGQWRIPVESTIEKIRKARELGAQGFCLFAYGSATKGGEDDQYLRAVSEE